MTLRAGHLRLLLQGLLLMVCVTINSFAFALKPNEVPDPLKPWIRWALEGEANCPNVGEAANCVWPGSLELDLDEGGGRFRLLVTLDRRASVPLPGADTAWPQDVTVPGQVAVVLSQAGVPSVALAAGKHEIRGQFRWDQLPETLPIPPSIALIQLRLKGRPVASPKRDRDRIWLKADQVRSLEAESISLEVYRNLQDGVPFIVDTLLIVHASGRSRELLLGNVLLPGARPLALDTSLPVRLDQGLLHAQVHPGKHEIRFRSLFSSPPEELSRPTKASMTAVPFWPEREIWVFTPDSQVRQTKVSGASAIDPQQTGLPDEWKQLAAYSLSAEDSLTLKTERRGEPDPAPNRLSLQREMWLDLDGQAYTVRDSFSGSLHRGWRLDLLQGQLGRVVAAGSDQLVTTGPNTQAPGVELRQGQVQMVAEWRTNGSVRQLPAVGWSEDVQSLSARVHVPPGWRILSASGVDSISETWLSSWDLFALFFVLVVALAVGRLTHPAWGGLALITMVLTHGEEGAPFAIWLLLVAGIALLKVIPQGWFRHLVSAYTGLTGAALVLIVLSFAVSQVRYAVAPQAAEESGFLAQTGDFAPIEEAPSEGGTGKRASASSMLDLPAEEAEQRPTPPQQMVQKQQDPDAIIQTGPGVPTWSWNAWELNWSGPVHRDHSLQLYLLSPAESSLLSVLRTLLSFALAFILLRHALRRFQNPPPRDSSNPRSSERSPPRAASVAAKSLAVGIGLAIGLSSAQARAELPSQETLAELRHRLAPPADCAPNCLNVSLLELQATKTELRFRVHVHAGDTVSYQLPGPAANWIPRVVTLNGNRETSIMLGTDGSLHLRLPRGRHRVELIGPVGTELTLSPGSKAQRVEVTAPDWDVDGLSLDGQISGSLLLHRRLAENESPAIEPPPDGAVQLPSWAEVTRTFDFGVTWSAHTTVRRIGPLGAQTQLRVPLLPGEQVTTPGVTQDKLFATVPLARDQEAASFDSNLKVSDSLSLTAAKDQNFSEHWVLRCSPIWHCDMSGVAPTRHTNNGNYEPDFRPWPGESVDLTLKRPAPASGRHTTVDAATLTLSPGVRLLHGELDATVRTSTQSSLLVELPTGSEVQELLVDQAAQPIGRSGNALDVSLSPGERRVHVAWQQPGGMQTVFKSPEVKLNHEVVNARLRINLPEERWLLYAWGPRWGPAVLFWGYLILILILAPILALLPHSPLKAWQWVVLGVGLTQVPPFVAAIIVGWFFLFALSSKFRPKNVMGYNFAQLGLALYTVVFLGCLFGAVYDGLLSTPDMEVAGAGSSNRSLSWYVDRSTGTLPTASVLSTSLWVWRLSMLAWALWLAWNLIRWLRWSWQIFNAQGLWRFGPKPPPKPTSSGGSPPPPGSPAGPLSPMPATVGSAHASGIAPVAVTHPHDTEPGYRDRPTPSSLWQQEPTPIEPLAGRFKPETGRITPDTPNGLSTDAPEDASERAGTEDLEERPTLPIGGEHLQGMSFTAFDFGAASAAIDRLDDDPALESAGTSTEELARAPSAVAVDREQPTTPVPIPLTVPAKPRHDPLGQTASFAPQAASEELGQLPQSTAPTSKAGGFRSDTPARAAVESTPFSGKVTPPGGFALGSFQQGNYVGPPPPPLSPEPMGGEDAEPTADEFAEPATSARDTEPQTQEVLAEHSNATDDER